VHGVRTRDEPPCEGEQASQAQNLQRKVRYNQCEGWSSP